MNRISELFDLSGKTALVTGASSGLGSHFARTLATAGAQTVLTARRTSLLEKLKDEIEAQGGEAFVAELDVTDTDSTAAVFNRGGPWSDRVDILINNAGVALGQAAEHISESDWDRVMDTNLKGAWLMSQAFARSAIARNAGGVIINIASILGQRVAKGVAPYSASKAALEHLTRSLALEWARYGIRVNAISPGYFDTDINREFLQTDAGRATLKHVPQRRVGALDELDGVLLLLASKASSYMTGSTLVVDGGHLCSSL